jgi:predicted permease
VFVIVVLRGFVAFAGSQFPRLAEVTVDFRVFGVALLTSLTAALLFSMLPVLRASRVDVGVVLQRARSGATAGQRLLRRALVGLEVALSVVLLTGALLLLQTLWHMQNDHLGFQPEHVFSVSIPLRGTDWSGPARQALASRMAQYLDRIPGTGVVSLTHCTPLTGGSMSITFSRSDRPLPEPFHKGDSVSVCGSDADYLKAAGGRLVAGRFFTSDDLYHPCTVAVINEAASRTYLTGENPLGKQIMGGRAASWKTVVGVMADAKNQGLNQAATPQVWINDTSPAGTADLMFLVRSLAPEETLARAFQEQVHEAHPGLFTKVQSLDNAMGQLTASPRFNTVLLSGFAVLALAMAIVGVYGVLAFSVGQRHQEIGIRMALGASPTAVGSLIMKEGAALMLLGGAAGVAGSLALTRSLTTLLYGVRTTDPATYLLVLASVALAAGAASFLPARRAARVEPMVALRHD